MVSSIKWNEGQTLLESYLLLGFIRLIWYQYYYVGVYLIAVARKYQHKVFQKHFQADVSLGHSNIDFSSFQSKTWLWTSSKKKSAISTLCCCRPSEEQPRGRDAQQFPKSLLSRIVSPLHARDTVSSLQELRCLTRGEFVLKKDMLSFPGNIYSRENKPDAEEAWRGLHNGGENSFLPSSASRTLGIPISLGAWDHNGKASQFFLNSFEKLLHFSVALPPLETSHRIWTILLFIFIIPTWDLPRLHPSSPILGPR